MFFNDDMGENTAPETQEDVNTQAPMDAPVADDAAASTEEVAGEDHAA